MRHVELVPVLENDCDESGVFSVEAQHHTGRPSTMQHYMLRLINGRRCLSSERPGSKPACLHPGSTIC
jgi:hypothetical protein